MAKAKFYALSAADIFTSSGKYPERANSAELTDSVKENIENLRERVNGLLKDIGMSSGVTSGFRPTSVNAMVSGASKTSHHAQGRAVDLEDADGLLKNKILSAPHLLVKWGLWMEDPASTPTWCHLDVGSRKERLIRVFKP